MMQLSDHASHSQLQKSNGDDKSASILDGSPSHLQPESQAKSPPPPMHVKSKLWSLRPWMILDVNGCHKVVFKVVLRISTKFKHSPTTEINGGSMLVLLGGSSTLLTADKAEYHFRPLSEYQ